MKSTRHVLFLAASLVLPTSLAYGGVNRWTTSGPFALVSSLAVDPLNAETVYAGTGREVLKSTDGGLSWTVSLTVGPSGEDSSGLAIDFQSASTVYAATAGGVFKSVNAGGSWAAAGPPVSNPRAYSVAVDPAAPSTVYAGTADGLFRSNNGGASWSGRLLAASVYSLVFSPESPSAVLAADYDFSFYYATPSRLYKSTAAATWTQSYPGFWILPGALAVHPTNPAIVYVGTGHLYRSGDYGATWQALSVGSPYVSAVVVDPRNPSTLYAGTSAGVRRSRDGGATWEDFNTGLTDRAIYSMAIDRTGTRLYAGTFGGGVFEYTVSEGLSFYTVAPCRVADTRDPPGPHGGPALAAGDSRVFTIAGRCGVPPSAKAAALNVTVTAPTDQGSLSLYPGGTSLPLVSALNYSPGQTRANKAIVALGGVGDLAVFCGQGSGAAHFVIDVNGYFE